MDSSGAPFLSVILPVFNGVQTLERTLQSLLGQERNIEIIVVVQSGADGSSEILTSFMHRLPMLVIDAPSSTTWIKKSNIGLAAARAPFCTFLHQDDIWLEGRAEALNRLVRQYPHASLWVHDASFIDREDRSLGRFGPPFGRSEALVRRDEAFSKLFVQNTLSLPAVMFKRESAVRLGGLDEELWYTADWDLWLRLAGEGDVAWLPRRLAGFRLHSNSLTVTGSRDLPEFRRQMEVVTSRYAGVLPADRAERTRKMAVAAIAMNVCLAGLFHLRCSGCWTALGDVLRLGPIGMGRLMHDTQISHRVLSRIRAFLGI